MTLRDGLFISGFTETSEDLSTGKTFDSEDRDMSQNSDDEFEGVEVKQGSTSIATIEEVLSEGQLRSESVLSAQPDVSSVPASGIFILNYKFAHTLNHFLFHMPERLDSAGVTLCIIPAPVSAVGEALRLPSSFGKLSIVVPPSLKTEGKYAVVSLSLVDGKWEVDSVES